MADLPGASFDDEVPPLDESLEAEPEGPEVPEAVDETEGAPSEEAGSGLVALDLVGEKPEKRKQVALFVGEEQLRDLWERASRAKKEVDARINNPAVALQLLDQIRYARNELLAGKENYEQAERYINEVEYRVAFSGRVYRWSTSLGMGLFIYETVWAVILLLFLFLVLGTGAFSSSTTSSPSRLSSDVVFLLGSMTWGGLGGVIGAWLSLIKHISKDQDFDRQHLLWYINSPVMGIGVGAVIFVVLRAGLLSITGPAQEINSPLVIYLLAWLSGFQQNVFTDLIKRVLQVFKIEEEKEAEKASPTPPLTPITAQLSEAGDNESAES